MALAWLPIPSGQWLHKTVPMGAPSRVGEQPNYLISICNIDRTTTPGNSQGAILLYAEWSVYCDHIMML